ncbi:hypothetical protein HBH92_067260 [Parastagonospora nodorum]|nr:hypothetical protein HBH43_110760 [Parastagonospora nodorum]KAH4416026.1 hypothetical protein HBH92_067260 [Parastagonospora nodorum]KAH4443840.1 hypothetical protein HBH93_066140 [Parastagonospora nodorum]KAH4456748.1 hypothetical protein HBH91_097940 [Parastagonospora nodorum]KAH4493574.1 hypothetical protein HBH89_160400 [Parastagonospora nodorum]
MGITVSHTNYAPISLVSALIGFVSFAFTLGTFIKVFWSNLGTFIKVFWSNLGTFAAAPQEIHDYLSSLKQGLLEERRHLRRSRRRLRNIRRDQSHGRAAGSGCDDDYARTYSGRGKRRSSRARKHQMHFDRDMQSMRSSGEEAALRVMRVTVKDLIKSFRELEQPFLKAEFQQQDSAQWSQNSPSHSSYYPEKHQDTEDRSDDDSPGASHCALRTDLVTSTGNVVSKNAGSDMHALEGRLNRVVGVRRVE